MFRMTFLVFGFLAYMFCVMAVLREECREIKNSLTCKNKTLKPPFATQDESISSLIIVSCELNGLQDELHWFTKLKTLSIKDSDITSVSNATFQVLSKITRVQIDNCRISLLPSDLFVNNNDLSYISFRNNNINDITKDFKFPLRLQRLDLHGNKIKEVKSRTFITISEVEDLDLSGNDIWRIEVGAFNISGAPGRNSSLKLAHNRLDAVAADTFHNCSTLETLDLSHNHIAWVAATAFRGLKALHQLDLRANRLRGLSGGVLAPLTALVQLSLDANELTHVDKDAFAFCDAMLHLSLARNRLESLPEGAFGSLQRLRTLRLDHNAISRLPPDIFCALRVLERLWLHGNDIEGACASLFCNSLNLVEVHVDHSVCAHDTQVLFAHADVLYLHTRYSDDVDFVSFFRNKYTGSSLEVIASANFQRNNLSSCFKEFEFCISNSTSTIPCVNKSCDIFPNTTIDSVHESYSKTSEFTLTQTESPIPVVFTSPESLETETMVSNMTDFATHTSPKHEHESLSSQISQNSTLGIPDYYSNFTDTLPNDGTSGPLDFTTTSDAVYRTRVDTSNDTETVSNEIVSDVNNTEINTRCHEKDGNAIKVLLYISISLFIPTLISLIFIVVRYYKLKRKLETDVFSVVYSKKPLSLRGRRWVADAQRRNMLGDVSVVEDPIVIRRSINIHRDDTMLALSWYSGHTSDHGSGYLAPRSRRSSQNTTSNSLYETVV